LNTTGTVSVALSDDNGTTQTREVTVDASDLPDQNSWVFFKFGTTLTGDGGNDYRVQVKGSSAGNAVFFRDATAGNWARLLRRDSTATIATTDVVYISGERTGAGSVTPITVTMNQTATTSYGAMNIGDAGTVSYGTSASTNYYLRLAGNLNVLGNGTLNIGTSTTRIPSTSTAVLEFNNASAAQFGLNLFSGSTFNAYGAQKRSWSKLTANAASGQAVLTVEDTTGWVAGDLLEITRTDRNVNALTGTISTVDSSTQVTLTANLSVAVGGVFPYQGAIGNTNKNVIIRGISDANHSFVLANSRVNLTFNADNTTFAQNRDIRLDGSTGAILLDNCGLPNPRVVSSAAIQASSDATIRNCVIARSFAAQAYSGSGTIEDNLFFRCGNGSFAMAIFGSGAVVTGNYFANSGNANPVTSQSGVSISGVATFSNNTLFGLTNAGLNVASGTNLTMSSNNFFRNVGRGVTVSSGVGLVFDSCRFDGNSLANVRLSSSSRFENCVFEGGATLTASAFHLDFQAQNLQFESCTFGQSNTAGAFADVLLAGRQIQAVFTNCDVTDTLNFTNQTNLLTDNGTLSIIGFDKLNSTSGNHRAYKRFGYAGSDQSVYRTASPSEVLVPNSASGKLPSGSKKFGVASGNDATVSVWVRKSSTYNGAEPRLILKRNIVGGVTSDQVLATLSGGTEEWLELTASTPTVTDDCVLEVYVDCSATAGVVNIDDWAIS